MPRSAPGAAAAGSAAAFVARRPACRQHILLVATHTLGSNSSRISSATPPVALPEEGPGRPRAGCFEASDHV